MFRPFASLHGVPIKRVLTTCSSPCKEPGAAASRTCTAVSPWQRDFAAFSALCAWHKLFPSDDCYGGVLGWFCFMMEWCCYVLFNVKMLFLSCFVLCWNVLILHCLMLKWCCYVLCNVKMVFSSCFVLCWNVLISLCLMLKCCSCLIFVLCWNVLILDCLMLKWCSCFALFYVEMFSCCTVQCWNGVLDFLLCIMFMLKWFYCSASLSSTVNGLTCVCVMQVRLSTWLWWTTLSAAATQFWWRQLRLLSHPGTMWREPDHHWVHHTEGRHGLCRQTTLEFITQKVGTVCADRPPLSSSHRR